LTEVVIFDQVCKGMDDCGICNFVCPKNLFKPCSTINEAGHIPPQIIDSTLCNGCMNCMIYCPDMAIVVKKTSKRQMEDETID
jgi:2-oxoglutarate ferredoxin oxidoreductase subunit delta